MFNYLFSGFQGYGCSSADVTLFKGFFQIPIFGAVILFFILSSNKNSKKTKDAEKETEGEEAKKDAEKEITFMPSRHKDKAWTLAYGIFNGARFAAFYGAVLFMPMADYIVCIATTPIFSYIFSILLIKSKFTILKVYIILELRIKVGCIWKKI